MRNFNTSFIKNAISFFAYEANIVLRAIALANPVATVLRLIQSVVRTLRELVEQVYQLIQGQPSPANDQGKRTTFDRILSVMSGGDFDSGNCRWDCRLSHTAS